MFVLCPARRAECREQGLRAGKREEVTMAPSKPLTSEFLYTLQWAVIHREAHLFPIPYTP